MQVECHNQCERLRLRLRYHGLLDFPYISFEPVRELHI